MLRVTQTAPARVEARIMPNDMRALSKKSFDESSSLRLVWVKFLLIPENLVRTRWFSIGIHDDFSATARLHESECFCELF